MAQRYIYDELRELAHQMRFAPATVRLVQLESAERLIDAIEPRRDYPYDFVVFKLTEYRSRQGSDRESLAGRSLIGDLCALVEQVSATLNTPVDALPEAVYSIDDLAERFNVATKTISRWRGRGLSCRRLVFADGKRRVGFLAGVVDRFVARNQKMVLRGRQFSHLGVQERMEIIERARRLVRDGAATMHEVATDIANRTGRAVETIRYTIKRHDENQPDRAVFRLDVPKCPDNHEIMYQCFVNGDKLNDLGKRFDRTRAETYRTIMDQRLARLQSEPIEYIYSAEFDLPTADDLILSGGDLPADERPTRAPSGAAEKSDGLLDQLPGLYETPLLQREPERELFRRFNYLKFRAEQLRAPLAHAERPRNRTLTEVEALLDRACRIRNHLVQANMRLVASIARKHVRDESGFLEAVSDGSIAMMRAIEKFDYGRGFKFSTYASWAVMRTYARTVPEEACRRGRFQTGLDELLEAAPDFRADEAGRPSTETVRGALDTMLATLTDREQTVVRRHFGLGSDDAGDTLAQISKGMGVSKERIRQIEARAIRKLRRNLTPQIIDQLFPLGA